MEEYKNILKLAKILDGKQLLTTDELTAFVTDIVNAFAQIKATHKEITQEHKDVLNTALKQLNAEHDRILKDVEKETDLVKREVQRQINTLLLEAEALKAEIFSMKPQDGHNPMHTGIYPPINPKKGDLWYKN